jgi:hypothetical protein
LLDKLGDKIGSVVGDDTDSIIQAILNGGKTDDRSDDVIPGETTSEIVNDGTQNEDDEFEEDFGVDTEITGPEFPPKPDPTKDDGGGGTPETTPPPAPTPETTDDLGGNDDLDGGDIVGRQIDEAIRREQDPEMRGKLIDEWEKYTGRVWDESVTYPDAVPTPEPEITGHVWDDIEGVWRPVYGDYDPTTGDGVYQQGNEAPTEPPENSGGSFVNGVWVPNVLNPTVETDSTVETESEVETDSTAETESEVETESTSDKVTDVVKDVVTAVAGTGTGSGNGDGDGDGNGDGNGNGDGMMSGGGDYTPQWGELFAYTTLTPYQKKALAPHVDYIKKGRGMLS